MSEIWEKDVFIDKISKFNNRDDKEFADLGIIPLVINRMAERSIPDELQEMNSSNVLIVVISYILMFLYIALAMGEFSLVGTKILLALGGILVVVISFLCSVSLVSLLGVKLSLISAEVVPFLVLAIGVDNMFIITGTKKRIFKLHPELEIIPLIGLTMNEAGPSITVASLCEFLAFIVGYLTNIPALQSFCLAAAFAVILDFLLQITLFLAFVCLDDTRVRENRIDIFPCYKITSTAEVLEESEDCSTSCITKVVSVYTTIIMSKGGKICIPLFYVGLIVISILGFINLTLGLDQRVSVITNSEIFKYFEAQIKLIDVGPPAYLVFNDLDFTNQKTLEKIDNLVDYISQLSTVITPIYSWTKDFKKFMRDDDWTKDCNPDLANVKFLPFETQVKLFLQITVDSSCCTQFGLCGESYSTDISFDEENKIQSSRFRFQHIPLREQKDYVNSLVETKKAVKKFSDDISDGKLLKFEAYNNKEVEIDKIYPYSLFYVFFDQYLVIRGVWIENLLIALAAIFLACQIIASTLAALFITLLVLSNVITLIGMLYLFNLILPGSGIEINAVSVVNAVMACGLSVEFIVHIVIFYLKKQGSFKEKFEYSVRNVGLSVFVGIVTTKLIGNLLYFIF